MAPAGASPVTGRAFSDTPDGDPFRLAQSATPVAVRGPAPSAEEPEAGVDPSRASFFDLRRTDTKGSNVSGPHAQMEAVRVAKIVLTQVLDERVFPFTFSTFKINASHVDPDTFFKAEVTLGDVAVWLDGVCAVGQGKTDGCSFYINTFEITDILKYRWFIRQFINKIG